MAVARKEDSPVMLSAAKHLNSQRDRPFAAAQGDKKKPVKIRRGDLHGRPWARLSHIKEQGHAPLPGGRP